jgi:hypothetical protein
MRPQGGLKAALATCARGLSLAGALALAAPSCGGGKPLPSYLANSTAEVPKFPRRSYITAVGISGLTADDSANQARRQVSEQISLQLKSETSSYLSATSSDGKSSEAQKITQTLQTATAFERADLIDIVERQQSEGSWYALGVLDRARADGEIARARQADLISFGSFVDSALEARQMARQGDYATAKSRALKLLVGIDQGFIIRRALLGRPAPDEEGFLAKRNALLKVIADHESRTVIQVRVQGGEATQLLKQAVTAVRKLGLQVAEAKTCNDLGKDQKPEDVTNLAVLSEEACGEGSLGEKCEVTVRLHAVGCGGGEGEGRTPTVRGVHPSERARARNSAWGKITAEMVESAVNEALRGAQVLD